MGDMKGDGRVPTASGDARGVILVDDDGESLNGKRTPYHSATTGAAADTEYEITYPARLSDGQHYPTDATTAWRWSQTQGVVAGGGGAPVAAGKPLSFKGPMDATTIYWAHSSGSSQTMNTTGEIVP